MRGWSIWHAVYFVQVEDRIKIGWSTWPESRAKTLHGRLLGYLSFTTNCRQHCEHERAMHERWKHLRISQNAEWFRAEPELLEWVASTGDAQKIHR